MKKRRNRSPGKMVLVVVLCTAAAAVLLHVWMITRPVTVDRGASALYSDEEIDRAVEVVKARFAEMKGCRLISLSYAGDEKSREELDYYNRALKTGGPYTDCIVLNSKFRSPIFGGGAWGANSLYQWGWILVKTGDGPWTVLTSGYG